ncbi:hypothetical protein [Parapedobacter luteus]|uniref:hypothetical protein n=1 Tax=Parapedobacter luteus TaxID=623280 RepID=UPI001590459E|nr:hypothetical protein [Parapedobacter luteus]
MKRLQPQWTGCFRPRGCRVPVDGACRRATLTDENPATNPPGEFRYVNDTDYYQNHQYYAWQDCHMDDTFTFKNGRFNVDDNKTVCPDGNGRYHLNTKTQRATAESL